MTLRCDCGHPFTQNDIAWVEMAGPDWYPYEGNVIGLCCSVCGCITEMREPEVATL
jgi:hypothetical protein